MAEVKKEIEKLEDRIETIREIVDTVNIAFAGRLDEMTKEMREMKSDIQALKTWNGSSRKDNDLDSIEVGNSKLGKVKIYYNRKEDSIETVEKDLENARQLAQETLRKMEAGK